MPARCQPTGGQQRTPHWCSIPTGPASPQVRRRRCRLAGAAPEPCREGCGASWEVRAQAPARAVAGSRPQQPAGGGEGAGLVSGHRPVAISGSLVAGQAAGTTAAAAAAVVEAAVGAAATEGKSTWIPRNTRRTTLEVDRLAGWLGLGADPCASAVGPPSVRVLWPGMQWGQVSPANGRLRRS